VVYINTTYSWSFYANQSQNKPETESDFLEIRAREFQEIRFGFWFVRCAGSIVCALVRLVRALCARPGPRAVSASGSGFLLSPFYRIFVPTESADAVASVLDQDHCDRCEAM
jgi:hypothetical protein